MIDFADRSDFGRICRLWAEAFGDDEDYIRLFLDRRFSDSKSVVFREGEEIASMLFLLDAPVKASGKMLPAKYIYAACTAKDKRGKGIMGELIRFSLSYSAEQGSKLVSLVPGNQSLFDYYSRFGFTPAFCKKTVVFSADSLKQIAASNIKPINAPMFSFDEIERFRSNEFLCGDAVAWSAQAIQYAVDENAACGGKTLFFEDKPSFVLIRQAGNTAYIKECCVLPCDFSKAAGLILAEYPCNKYVFTLPAGYPLSGGSVDISANAMIFPVDKSVSLSADAYLGLPLD